MPILFMVLTLMFSTVSFAGEEQVGPELIKIDGDDLVKIISDGSSRITIVNVWATWCQPCREEFPDILRIYKEYSSKGLRLILVSTDFQRNFDQAKAFLRKQGVDFPSYLKIGADEEFIDSLHPEWQGALPATFVFDAEGNKTAYLIGKVDHNTLEEAVKLLLE